MRNRLSAVYFILFILLCFSQTFARRNDFDFDVSPLYTKIKCFQQVLEEYFPNIMHGL
ncbi:hypothetical protein OGZ02_00145 [Brachyspira hyodysenteriae]|nr:hypothetical protein [Brachyspira hyodysenteriae]MDA1467287.1 hypothetical protein [Brachyspira hyodysenteriae]